MVLMNSTESYKFIYFNKVKFAVCKKNKKTKKTKAFIVIKETTIF